MPVKAEYLIKESSWTLGSIKSMYNDGQPGEANTNWLAFTRRASSFQITRDMLIQQFVDPMVMKEQISDLRNKVAHGQRIDKETASKLRNAILGGQRADGLLVWIVRNIGREVIDK